MMKPEAFPLYDNEALDEGNVIMSYSGIQVDTSGPNWIIGVDSAVYWLPFENLHSDLLSALKAYARHLIQASSPAHVENQLRFMNRLGDASIAKSAFDDLEREGYVTRRTYNAFAALLNGVVADVHHSNYLGAFIRWYLWCADCGLPGFDDDVATDLDSIRLKAAPRSAAVMRQDPQSGPLRRSEYEPLEIALRSQRATELPLVDRVIVVAP